MWGEVAGFIPYFLAAFIISVLTVPLFRGLSYRVDALDKGGGRRAHTGIIPRLGGGGIFCAFLLPVAYLFLTRNNTGKLPEILFASLIVFAFGVYDDLKGSRISIKLIAEIMGALVLYFLGVRVQGLSGINGVLKLGWLSLPVTVLWIIIVTNAVNLIDGLDGLAAGTGILVSVTLILVHGGTEYTYIACVLLIGSLAGFLVYNFPPASVFMGDSGSLFTGFILAALSVTSSAKASTMAALMVPMLAFSVPLMDMSYAVLRRYYRGMPLGQADREHIHHKLLEKGLSRKRVLFVLYSMNAAAMLFCLVMVGRSGLLSVSALAVLLLLTVLGLRIFGYIEFVPFAREVLKNIEKSRKGRYYHYLIKQFRKRASRADSIDSLRYETAEFIRLTGIIKAEIILERPAGREGGKPFLIYAGGSSPKMALTVAFPIVHKGGPSGQVRLTGTGGDFTLYCAGAAQAISEEISGFFLRDLPNTVALDENMNKRPGRLGI